MATNYDDSMEITGTIIDTVLDGVNIIVAKDVKFKHKIRHLTSIEEEEDVEDEVRCVMATIVEHAQVYIFQFCFWYQFLHT